MAILAGGVNAVVDLELKAAHTRPYDGGAVEVADARGGPEVGVRATERTTPKYTSCREHDSPDTPNR